MSNAQLLIALFLYVKKFYPNVLDALHAMLEVILAKNTNLDIPPNILASGMSLRKINRLLTFYVKRSDLEEFLHEISQQQTKNKLYFYSTPKELNRLMLGLLELENNESFYNPCFGLGGIFLSLNEDKNLEIYGEELDGKLSQIAKLLLEIIDLDSANLYASDLLKEPKFIDENSIKSFDKILCDPPVFARIGMKFLKNDLRFSDVIIPASYPELAFLAHSLMHLKNKGVFLIQNLALSKDNAQKSFKALLAKNNMIEAIIKLPPNLFPYRKNNFCIVVISKNNNKIQYIDATSFVTKSGKYNRLDNINVLLDAFQSKSKNEFSHIIDAKEFFEDDNFTLKNLLDLKDTPKTSALKSLGFSILRGQSLPQDETGITYCDIATTEFAPLGFSTEFNHEKITNDKTKLKKLSVKKFDIIISLRGKPKITIVGDIKNTTIINSSMVLLRHKDMQIAISMYCYLFTQEGQEALQNTQKDGRILDISELDIPRDLEKYAKIWDEISKIQEQIKVLDLQINALKCQKY
ncbi:MAG: N-6 DNA methylase [Helicobacter sp.]|nr:N-6 DNA methylase [Helicobacter sp.]